MILLLTHSGDFYTIDGVEAGLRQLGADYFRIDSDRFPLDYTLTACFPGGYFLESAGHELALDQVQAVWNRRLYPGFVPPELPPETARFCAESCRTAFLDTLALLTRAYWMNPVRQQNTAESKLLQLSLASEVGLRVPPTLVTNRPDEVRTFMAHHPNLITKLLVQPVQSMEAHPAFAYTTRVREEHLGMLDQLRLMPQIFQPELVKRSELRVIVVGRKVFVGALSGIDPDMVDWRQATADDGLTWTPGLLDPALEARVFALMDRLELRFGALDFLDDGSGEPWFLEINPAGEWGWLQRDLGFPIAETIARCLVERA
ncbi:MAG: MvdC/MvdD family ATP grasp protein [Candidatus Eremiobacterota bacterium]